MHSQRFYAKFKALMYAAQAAEDNGEPFGVWLDSLGFIVSPMSAPVTREDAALVAQTNP